MVKKLTKQQAEKKADYKAAEKVDSLWKFLAFLFAKDPENDKTTLLKICFLISVIINIVLVAKYTTWFSTIFKSLIKLAGL